MRNSDTMKIELPKSMLLLGAPGAGKTTLAMRLGRAYILDCDNNLSGPRRYLESIGKAPQFLYDRLDQDDDGKPVPRELQYKHAMKCLLAAATSPDVDIIIIDSLTSFIEAAFTQVLLITEKVPEKSLEKVDPKFEFSQWAAFGSLMKKFIFWLKSSDKTIIFTGHVTVDKDELENKLLSFINIPGALKHTISGWFQEVWELYPETSVTPTGTKAVYKIRTVGNAQAKHLGLKSSVGLKPVQEIEIEALLKKLKGE